jgi:hypothetical protein
VLVIDVAAAATGAAGMAAEVKGDFDQFRGIGSDRVNAWGRRAIGESGREQCVDIDSALVCRDRSDAFLRAAQAAEPYDVAIPGWEADSEINSGPFQLKGWVRDATFEENLEEFDPWARDIQIPAPEPAQHVIEALGLASDTERRVWTWVSKDSRSEVCWSQVWGGKSRRSRGTRGQGKAPAGRPGLFTSGSTYLRYEHGL